jgi:hypothetical protein
MVHAFKPGIGTLAHGVAGDHAAEADEEVDDGLRF